VKYLYGLKLVIISMVIWKVIIGTILFWTESDYAEILDGDEKSKCKEDRSKVLRESSPILPLQGLHNLHTYEECGTEIIKKGI
jgi:hypothetical protein